MKKILIGNVRVGVDATESEILKKATDKMKRAGLSTASLHFRLYKKSIDARNRDDIRLVCTVLAEGSFSVSPTTERKLKLCDAKVFSEESDEPIYGDQPLGARPMVVGMGPAGLFAALLLARNGYAPIIIDRGAPISERVLDVASFKATGKLNTESNIQFGAGGAGTFSDGKLITRIHDPRCSFVLKTLCEFGAPEDIMVQAKPHIGTDLLQGVVDAMLKEIEALGGEVRYHCKLEDFCKCSDGVIKARTSCGEMLCGAIVLAPGHSARDTYERLLEKNFAMEPKPISVGVRAEHLQADIDAALFGKMAGHPNLGRAEYSLSDTKTGRGVYTFCMCPGGEVVAAASEEERLVVNGMSNRARDGKNANAAVAVSVACEDVAPKNGSKILGMIQFQRDLEHAAYLAGGGNFYAPVMTLGDFMQGTRGSEPKRVFPSYRDGLVKVSDFESVFPPFVLSSLRYGFASFGKKLKGYDDPDTVLTAAETRTSAPLRILRDPTTYTALGNDLIYPCGEGAGYAGGITSASVDGVRVAYALMARFRQFLK